MSYKKGFAFFLLLLSGLFSLAQDNRIGIKVINEKLQSVHAATVELLSIKDSSLLKVQLTDSNGLAVFTGLSADAYLWRISHIGFQSFLGELTTNTSKENNTIVLHSSNGQLANITITGKKPFIEMKAGKTVVNVEASITSTGATVMETLEKLPGITVDKDGNISLKGKSGVTVMIDGKQTFLDPSQLATLLNGMSASQLSQVEIMENPGARYDAAGNAGIINIKTKKNRQLGFNGSVSTAYSQGRYPKNNNSLQLNYRNGRWNVYANLSSNLNKQFTRIYALRTYYENDGKTVDSYLEQPGNMRGKATSFVVRTGADYSFSSKTSAGININGLLLDRENHSDNPALWMDAYGQSDSLIKTFGNTSSHWKNAGLNLNMKHAFSSSEEWTADIDLIGYEMDGRQYFENNMVQPSPYSEATRAELPGDIRIFSAKTDYKIESGTYLLETGLKTSRTNTDNIAAYEFRDGSIWKPDFGKTNHFLYDESIHALYASLQKKYNKITMQGGLRYEMTNYDAHQLGNTVVKDSSFSRSYNSLFPTVFASWEADSSNSFSFSAGRRIDRPAFQKLNPFTFIINKYTYQRGNPFYRPQYTWNVELNYSYKNKLLAGLSYSITRDYFAQVFPIDSNGIVIYTEGNLGSMRNFGATAGLQLSPTKSWSFNLNAVLNYKVMRGFIEKMYEMEITQLQLNLNSQVKLGKNWSAEVSGFYTSKSQHDIQEIVDPAGQLSAGLSKILWKNKATVKLAVRDVFYTQWMKGFTYFTNATEYFKLTRDTRVVNLSFTYRFGKSFKTSRRSGGAAGEEIQRVGNG